jgi:hypothetical protein
MKMDDSNRRYSRIIAGILVLFVSSIFVANLIGFGGYSINSSNALQLQSAGIPMFEESNNNLFGVNSSRGENNDVHIAQNCEIAGLDTEAGSIEYEDHYIDDPIPLCLTPEEVEDWWMVVKVIGGYELVSGNLEIWQKGSKVYNPCYTGPGAMYLGWDLATAEDVTDQYSGPGACCCIRYYNLSLDPYLCNNWGCIESNQYPPECAGCDVIPPQGCGTIPGKDVTLKIWTTWQGCDQECQQFEIIYAHKNYISGISQLPNKKIFIASCMQ